MRRGRLLSNIIFDCPASSIQNPSCKNLPVILVSRRAMQQILSAPSLHIYIMIRSLLQSRLKIDDSSTQKNVKKSDTGWNGTQVSKNIWNSKNCQTRVKILKNQYFSRGDICREWYAKRKKSIKWKKILVLSTSYNSELGVRGYVFW